MESVIAIVLDFIQDTDSVFFFVLLSCAIAFFAGELIWIWVSKRVPKLSTANSAIPKDDARFELLWTLIPAFILICLCFVRPSKEISTAHVPAEKTERLTSPRSPQAKHYEPIRHQGE